MDFKKAKTALRNSIPVTGLVWSSVCDDTIASTRFFRHFTSTTMACIRTAPIRSKTCAGIPGEGSRRG